MFKLKYLLALFLILQTLAFNANAIDHCRSYTFERKFIKSLANGIFQVQDFYPTGEKRSAPFLLTDEAEARKKDYTVTFCDDNESPHVLSIEGKYTTYYKSGGKEMEGNYQKGYRIGKWTDWYETGEKVRETTYQDNKDFIGYAVEWYKNGRKGAEGKTRYLSSFMVDTELVGIWKNWAWSKNGHLLSVFEMPINKIGYPKGNRITRCHGMIIEIKQFDENSKVTADLRLPIGVQVFLGCAELIKE